VRNVSISSTDNWVQMLCPLIRRKADGDREIGYMVNTKPVVYLGNMFTASARDPRIEYDNLAAIINDGWLVD
jgi:hypothetical protein